MTMQSPSSQLLPANNTTELTGWRLFAARLVWMALTGLVLLLLVLFVIKDPLSMMNDRLVGKSYQALTSFFSYNQYIAYVVFIRYLVTGIFILVGILIFGFKSRDWMALLSSSALICLPFISFYSIVLGGLSVYFPTGWANFFNISVGLVMAAGILSILTILFVFPDGRSVPRSMIKPVKGLLMIFLALLIFSWIFPSDFTFWFLLPGIGGILFLAGIYAQIYRYKRISTPAQRLQTKWIVYTILLNLFWFIFALFEVEETLGFTAASIYSFFELHASVVIISLIPISVAFSVLRYRLWDIDLIIRRTLVYSLLTGVLSGLYFGGVALLQNILTADRGRQTAVSGQTLYSTPSAVVIVLTTLSIAALANPLRRRIQNAIDRRFYRQKYDAEKALAAFADSARSETDHQVLAGSMVKVVQNTLQPQVISVWFTSNIAEGRS